MGLDKALATKKLKVENLPFVNRAILAFLSFLISILQGSNVLLTTYKLQPYQNENWWRKVQNLMMIHNAAAAVLLKCRLDRTDQTPIENSKLLW
jgi:hypothetical protein